MARTTALLLCLIALAAALAFGATRPDHMLLFEIALALLIALWALSPAFAPRAVWLVVLATTGLALYVTPLPRSLLGLASPLSLRLNEQAAAVTGLAPVDAVSVDVGATLASMPRWLLLGLVVIVVASLGRGRRARRILVAGVATVAVATILLGFIAPRDSTRVLWFYEVPRSTADWRSPLLSPYHSAAFALPVRRDFQGVPYTEDTYSFQGALGSMINQNQFAALLGVSLPLALAALLGWGARRKRRRRRARTLAAGLAGAALWLIAGPASSLGGTIALAASLVTFAAIAWRPHLIRRPVRWLAGLALLGLAGSLLLAYVVPDSGLTGRPLPWRAAVKTFCAAPALGSGPGTFASFRVLADHGDANGAAFISYFAHNGYLQVLAATGLLGLGLLCLIVFRYGQRRLRTSRPARSPYLVAGVLGGIVFALVHAGIDYAIQVPATALILAIEIGLLLSLLERGPTPRQRPWHAPSRAWARIIVVGGMLGIVWMAGRALRTEHTLDAVRRATARELAWTRDEGHPRKPRPTAPEQSAALRAALRQAAAAAGSVCSGSCPSAKAAQDIGYAWLVLSGGEPGPERERARAWLARSLWLDPANPFVRETVRALR